MILHAERVTSSQDHSASWIAAVVTKGHWKMFGRVSKFSQKRCGKRRFDWGEGIEGVLRQFLTAMESNYSKKCLDAATK